MRPNRPIINTLALCLSLLSLHAEVALTVGVYFKPGEASPPAFALLPAAPTACDEIRFQARTDGVTHGNPCTAEWPHNGHPVLGIDAAAREVRVRFVGPVPQICTMLYDPVNGVEGSFGRLSAGRWTFIMDPYGRFPFEVLPCSAPTFRITSFTRDGILSWTNAGLGGYCSLEFKESLGEPWRMAPYWYQNLAVTGRSGSLDLPLIREFASTNAPDHVLLAETAFFRLRWSPVPVDFRSLPTVNRVIVLNRSSGAIGNVVLGMVGSADTASVDILAPKATSAPLIFRLPARPNTFPISWSDYSGSYDQRGQRQPISIVVPPRDLRIIIGDTRFYLW